MHRISDAITDLSVVPAMLDDNNDAVSTTANGNCLTRMTLCLPGTAKIDQCANKFECCSAYKVVMHNLNTDETGSMLASLIQHHEGNFPFQASMPAFYYINMIIACTDDGKQNSCAVGPTFSGHLDAEGYPMHGAEQFTAS